LPRLLGPDEGLSTTRDSLLLHARVGVPSVLVLCAVPQFRRFRRWRSCGIWFGRLCGQAQTTGSRRRRTHEFPPFLRVKSSACPKPNRNAGDARGMVFALSTNTLSRLWHRTVTIHRAVQAGGAFRFSQPIFPSSGGALGASNLIQSTPSRMALAAVGFKPTWLEFLPPLFHPPTYLAPGTHDLGSWGRQQFVC
jgi:hypothetical protein